MLAPEALPLDACYRVCRDVARLNSKTFHLSSLCLAPDKRRAVWAVYAFCRTADDIADSAMAAAERLRALDGCERALRAAYEGCAGQPTFVALADAVARYDIPLQPALDLLRGARMDVVARRYETHDELRDYCYLVASTVGLLVLPILGALTPEAAPYGVTLGYAMQMTNILRDVGEDARMGRVYLPADDVRRAGCSDEAIFAGRVDDAFVRLMRYQIERVRRLYAQAEPGVALLAPESRYAVRLALTLYRGILDRIEENGYDVFTRRAHVPLRAKMLTALTVRFAR